VFTGKTLNSVENVQQYFAERARQSMNAPAAASKITPIARPAQNAARPKKLRAGATIRHPKYGIGTVLRREGEGDDAKLTVSFQGYGLKKLVEKYAGIQEE
jgi:DNA helicase-2/ATP-dependent DNA helicase PcrA